MNKQILLFLVIITLNLGLNPAQARTYRVGAVSTGWPGYAAVQVAKNKGFWKAQGIDVQVHLYTRIPDYINAMINKRVDISFIPLPSLVDFRKNGNNLIYLGTSIVSKPGDSIVIVKKDLVNQSLKGMRFGIPGNESFGKTIAANYLKKVNTRLSDVKLIYISAEELSINFIRGRLKAIYIYGSLVEKTLREGDGVLVDAASTQFGLSAYKDVYEGIPEVDMKKIHKGIILANQWMNNPKNWKEFQKILNRDFFKHLPEFNSHQLNQLLGKLIFLEPEDIMHHNKNTLPIVFNDVRNLFANEGSLMGEVLERFTMKEAILNQRLIETATEIIPEKKEKIKVR